MKFRSQVVHAGQRLKFNGTSLSVYGISALFIGAGLLHFIAPSAYMRIMPRQLPYSKELVYLSGAFEIIGGIAVLPPKTRLLAGYGLIVLLFAVFPANIQMLLDARSANASRWLIVLLWLRLPLQLLLVAWVYRATRADTRST